MDLAEQVILLTGTNKDKKIIELLLNKSKKEIEEYVKKPYSSIFDDLAVDITILKLNKLGTEGISSHSYSGSSESFIDGYPKEILLRLDTYKGKWGIL